MVQIRAAMLRKRGIRVMLFGKTDKSDFLLMPLILAIVYTVLANSFGLPMWSPLIHPFWNNTMPGWIGLTLCAISVIGFALTLASFGDSFRVGIDESKPDKLITSGMFKISRNPIYVCFLMFFAGLFLIHYNIVIAVAIVLFALAIHRQVKREEKFLASHYGDEYEEYRKKVRRYL
jgi:protein-S-isoprenylcysteine O-methyltransferase Ste14